MPTITGTSGADTLTGTEAADVIDAGAGLDRVDGRGGDDILVIRADGESRFGDYDIYRGGAGVDTAIGLTTAVWFGDFGGLYASNSLDLEASAVAYMTSVERIIGSDLSERYQVTSGEIFAAGGDDEIQYGNDLLLYAGTGDDRITVGAGSNLFGDAGDDTFLFSPGQFGAQPGFSFVYGGEGSDTLEVASGRIVLDLQSGFADNGTNRIIFTSVENVTVVVGEIETSSVFGDGADNKLLASSRGTSARTRGVTFDGRDGDDLLSGAMGGDLLSGGRGADLVLGGDGRDTVGGDDGDDQLFGGDGGDTISGGSGSDYVFGEGGDDRLAGNLGVNVIDGGAGLDLADYADRSTSLYVDLAEGHFSTADTYDTLVSIEGLVGGSGDDQLFGTAGADALFGGAGGDTLRGRDGDDRLAGGLGINTVDGGAGFDLADFSDRTEALWVDLAEGHFSTADTYDALISIEGLIGGSGSDQLFGTAAGDALFGGAGNDVLTGRDGDDVLSGGAGANDLRGGDGVDVVDYSARTEQLFIDLAAGYHADASTYDRFTSIEGVLGGSGDDRLSGTIGDDRLIGGGGQDILTGLEGDDLLSGGSESDVFELSGGGRDVVTDFVFGVDLIDLRTDMYGYVRFTALTETDANGDGVFDSVLTWDYGAFVVLNVTGLTLDDWNGYVL